MWLVFFLLFLSLWQPICSAQKCSPSRKQMIFREQLYMASGPMEHRELTPVKSNAAKHVNKEWKTGDSYHPLPNWNRFLPPYKPFHWFGINCFQRNYKFWIVRCSGSKRAIKFQPFEPTPSSHQTRLPLKKNKTKKLLQSSPAYFTKVRCPHRLGLGLALSSSHIYLINCTSQVTSPSIFTKPRDSGKGGGPKPAVKMENKVKSGFW